MLAVVPSFRNNSFFPSAIVKQSKKCLRRLTSQKSNGLGYTVAEVWYILCLHYFVNPCMSRDKTLPNSRNTTTVFST